MSIKFLSLGGVFWVWGGGKCRFYFHGREDFLTEEARENSGRNSRIVQCFSQQWPNLISKVGLLHILTRARVLTGEMQVSTSTVAALLSKMACQRIAMVDMAFLVFTACPCLLHGWMEPEFSSEIFFSCCLGGGGGGRSCSAPCYKPHVGPRVVLDLSVSLNRRRAESTKRGSL